MRLPKRYVAAVNAEMAESREAKASSVVIAQSNIPGAYAVTVTYVRASPSDCTFIVTYGVQVRKYGDAQSALAEFDDCVAHALVCAGIN